jgi:hypothetical protein
VYERVIERVEERRREYITGKREKKREKIYSR